MFRGYDRYIKTKRDIKQSNSNKEGSKNILKEEFPVTYCQIELRQRLIDEYGIYATTGEISNAEHLRGEFVGNTTVENLEKALREIGDYNFYGDANHHDKTRWDRNISLSKNRKYDRDNKYKY